MQVLDKGRIELKMTHGSDMLVVNAARASFGNEDWFKEIADLGDEKLINYLAKHRHVSPFYHTQMTFVVKLPISIHRQWEKHKIGTCSNTQSTRYSKIEEEVYIPERYRKQSASNKQGSDGYVDAQTNSDTQQAVNFLMGTIFGVYEEMINLGIAREQARGILPLDTYTTMVWSASLIAANHFIWLRDAPDAQWEIQEYARALRKLVAQAYPLSWKALEEHG